METKIRKWGNSHAVRIPGAFVKETQLTYGSSVDISVEEGKIIIDPNVGPVHDLNAMLEEIHESNLHDEIGSGDSVGREVW